MEILVSAIITIVAYLLVPVIISFAYKGALSRKKILIITITNGLVVWFLFRVAFALMSGNIPAASASMAPAAIWSIVAYFILQLRTGHMPEIVSIKSELDSMVSPNSTPFYVEFIKELKKELPNLSETIRRDLPRRECAYRIMYDYAQSKVELYTKLNQSQNLYQTQIQQYAKITSDAKSELQKIEEMQRREKP